MTFRNLYPQIIEIFINTFLQIGMLIIIIIKYKFSSFHKKIDFFHVFCYFAVFQKFHQASINLKIYRVIILQNIFNLNLEYITILREKLRAQQEFFKRIKNSFILLVNLRKFPFDCLKRCKCPFEAQLHKSTCILITLFIWLYYHLI